MPFGMFQWFKYVYVNHISDEYSSFKRIILEEEKLYAIDIHLMQKWSDLQTKFVRASIVWIIVGEYKLILKSEFINFFNKYVYMFVSVWNQILSFEWSRFNLLKGDILGVYLP